MLGLILIRGWEGRVGPGNRRGGSSCVGTVTIVRFGASFPNSRALEHSIWDEDIPDAWVIVNCTELINSRLRKVGS